MLEGLMRVKPDVKAELMEKAMVVAVEWNQKRMAAAPFKEIVDNALGFLLLVGAYGLIDGFSMDELIDCLVIGAKRGHTVDLCREMIPANKINDVMEKLIDRDLQVVAVRYSIELGKTAEFPPVRLLEERILKCMTSVDENKVGMKKEVRLIMKCIDEYRLETVYPKETLLALVKEPNNILPNINIPHGPPPKKQKLVQPPPPDTNNS